MMHLFLNLTSNQRDEIYLLIYRSASHLFPAKVSVRFQEREKKARKNDGFNWYDRCFSGIHYPCALLSREVDLALPDGHG